MITSAPSPFVVFGFSTPPGRLAIYPPADLAGLLGLLVERGDAMLESACIGSRTSICPPQSFVTAPHIGAVEYCRFTSNGPSGSAYPEPVEGLHSPLPGPIPTRWGLELRRWVHYARAWIGDGADDLMPEIDRGVASGQVFLGGVARGPPGGDHRRGPIRKVSVQPGPGVASAPSVRKGRLAGGRESLRSICRTLLATLLWM